jgi:hypothetical protein
MPLDFHGDRHGKTERLLQLDESRFRALEGILTEFERQTGIRVERFADVVLDAASQKNLIKIMDRHLQNQDLNRDRNKTIAIISFRALLDYFSGRDITLYGIGD